MNKKLFLTKRERRALLLLTAYENERRKKQLGYRVFKEFTEKEKQSPMFKQFLTIEKWIREFGYTPSWSELHWQGYIEYIFQKFPHFIPQPGQLKNLNLLKEYIRAIPNTTPPERTNKELAKIYRDVLSNKILNDEELLNVLDLRRLLYEY
jgi:hypothetical protein